MHMETHANIEDASLHCHSLSLSHVKLSKFWPRLQREYVNIYHIREVNYETTIDNVSNYANLIL